MAFPLLIQFALFDNPMHLSKVGNWVITFISPQEQLEKNQLAISSVLPIQMMNDIQPRRIYISQMDDPTIWNIDRIECFDSAQALEYEVNDEDDLFKQIIESMIIEFQRYDVELAIIDA
ncbi:hypothetical protein [Acinetobacter sp. ANC 3832]|uniref:hypothetical protein n=1 Tax=Acinetobacter sp. ANC 3832 TaxID=1977874 RepID=UPI000A356013|nr:hypothetical protein [Acinetobacter sp. ANC 3832]OTG93714.1 hypothetical protein B9T35_08310 [Acinetobacter sp. ANC 3832]